MPKYFLLTIIIGLLLIGIMHNPPLNDPDASRVAAIRALVEQRTLAIENIPIETVDKVRHNGHLYSAKPPLSIILGALVYQNFYTFKVQFSENIFYIFSVIIIVPFFLLLLAFFYKALDFWGLREWPKMLLTLTLGFGNILLIQAMTFRNHLPAATLIFIAFYFILKISFQGENKNNNIRWSLYAGLLAGAAIITEAGQSGIFALVFFMFFLWRDRTWKMAKNFVLGVLPFLMLYVVYNFIIGSTIWPVFLVDGLQSYPGSYWSERVGIDALKHPPLLSLFNVIIGTHGIFTYSPILLFGLFGLIRSLKRKNRFFVPAITGGVGILLVVLVLGLATQSYGGVTFGLRWSVITYPILFYFAGAFFVQEENKTMLLIIFAFLAVLSLFIAALGIHFAGFLGPHYLWGQKFYFALYDQLIKLFY